MFLTPAWSEHAEGTMRLTLASFLNTESSARIAVLVDPVGESNSCCLGTVKPGFYDPDMTVIRVMASHAASLHHSGHCPTLSCL